MNLFKTLLHTTRWYGLACLGLLALVGVFSFRESDRKILVFSKSGNGETVRLAHLAALRKVSSDMQLEMDAADSEAYFHEDSLKQYKAVVFLQTPPEVLDYRQQADFERYVQAGGGFMVLDAASDTVRNWPWYNALNLMRLKAGKPLWQTRYDGGKTFFAAISATASADELDKMLRKGLNYTLEKKELNYAKAKSLRTPETSRFVVETLDTYQYEPMEMVIFKDGRVLFLERRGEVKLYTPATKKTLVIARFDVSITGNYEDGMLGVALDPNFEQNHWIYINYSPAGKVAKQNVSRFEMIGDSLIRSSEKIVLEIPTQRETCCHSGGHLEFGPNGNLYISTGDNTSSKESDGFTPIDERPGRAPFDAQKSSGNTHDLRGKILRIHPEPNGSYTIPDGNLFPKDGSQGKPEIYVMGTRNAFRFSVDDYNGYVYWGDVGPDGGVTTERGPQSYDEFNQAKKPGNFGWPYFVADNKAYADFDFATNQIGPRFNPDRPENNSPNNTGAKILPPAQKPMIWYPYGESKEFPILGKGSRSAMAGPVYYARDFPAGSRFPDYYNGKLFIYEWARSWVKVVSFDENGDMTKIEPFLPEQEWYKPIDMKFGPDGSLYVLQYGANYFEHNKDARLVKITYVEGNRQPVARLSASKTIGAAPLKVSLSAEESFDYDKNDQLSYAWNVGQEGSRPGNQASISVTYDKPGIYRPVVTVTDREGKTATAELEIKVGNEEPRVSIGLGDANRTFYYDHEKIPYKVVVTDKEDGSLQQGIDSSAVFISFDYLKNSKDLALLASNTQMTSGVQFLRGKTLVANSDCKSCHDLSNTSIGPSYTAVAERYKGKNAQDMLAEKIIKGGNGNWGKNMMAAHPQHSREETTEMVKYILSLSDRQNIALPLQGVLTTAEHGEADTRGSYIIRASYTDKGNPVTGTLTGTEVLVLRHPKVQAEDFELNSRVGRRHVDGTDFSYVSDVQDGAYLGMKQVDLTSISKLHFRVGSRVEGSRIEIRVGAPEGRLLATAEVASTGEKDDAMKVQTVSIPETREQTDLYLVFRNGKGQKSSLLNLDWVYFDNDKQAAPKQ